MVKLNEINHTATFAWSNEAIPVLATGTTAGVIDDDFSSTSSLSFYSLYDRKPLLSVDADAKFHDLDWSQNNTLLAGALENGSIQFWNTEKLHSNKSVTSVATGSKHTGPIKSLAFNPLQHNVLASGGSNGEIFIWDTAKLSSMAPFAPGTAMTPMDTVTSVAWNNSVGHIFAAAGSSGYTSIWDLKSKKEVLHLTYTSQTGSRATLSTVAWHPTMSTKLITASESDGVPLILTWDLRNSNAPETILTGHKKGVLSLDWNARDPNLLLSCGKDNTTILWNPISGDRLAQYPTTANWAFKTRFAPQAPDVFATASFDKKVVVQTLQDTSPPVNKRIHSTTDNDFWNEISTTETQQPEYFVKQAPSWYGRKSSVAFGFGGKIVTVSKTGDKTSEITVKKAPLPGSAINEELSTALDSGDFKPIIESRLESSFEGINKADWELLNELDGSSNIFEKFAAMKLTDEERPSTEASGEEFYKDLNEHPQYSPSGEFKISEDSKELTDALLTKNFSKAVDISLREDKLTEALIIALNGPEELKEKVNNYYFNKYAAGDSAARLLYSIANEDVSDFVENGDVKNWREIGTAIKTYASPETSKTQFAKLGDRILAADPVKNRQDSIVTYISASALDKVAEIWNSELKDLEEKILESERTSVYDAHFASLSEFVEKFSAYRSTLNLDAPVTDTSSILSTILEYINIISTNGQFELASKFLSLLPSEVPAVKLEQERIAKATGVTKAAARRTTAVGAGASRYGNLAPVTATATPSFTPGTGYQGMPPVQPSHTQISRAGASNPYLPNAGAAPVQPPVPVPSYGYAPAVSPYAQKTPLYGQPAAPAFASNPYKHAAPVQATQAAPPPPPKTRKHETEGWNDLPTHFHQQPSRRPTPAAAVPPPTNGTFSPPQPPSLSRNASFASAPSMPPPPRSVSRSRKTPTIPEAKPAAPPQQNNRYAPASPQPNISELNGISSASNGFGPPPLNGVASAPPKNPYAPPAGSTPMQTPSTMYAPTQTPQANAPPVANPYGIPPPQPVAAAPPAVNPYAPTQNSAPPPVNPYAPQATPAQAYGSPAASAQAPYGSQPAYGAPPMSGPPKVTSAPPRGPATSAPPTATPAAPEKEKYPAGDRSHIPPENKKIYQVLDAQFKAAAPIIPESFSKQIIDCEKRLNFLYDHLNNQDLLTAPTLQLLDQLCDALDAKQYAAALDLHLKIMTEHGGEAGQWAVGVKRLVKFCEAAN